MLPVLALRELDLTETECMLYIIFPIAALHIDMIRQHFSAVVSRVRSTFLN
jgi:hypothetical protein